MNNYEKLLYKSNRQKHQLKILQDKCHKYKEVLDKIKKMFEHSNLIKYYYGMSYEFEINDFKDDILKLLEEIE